MVNLGAGGALDKVHDRFFRTVVRNSLIYNTCWEDPRIDRELLELNGESRVVMITSAGCNALDYLLDDPAAIDAVDLNFRQNALLHLKAALFRSEDRDLLYRMFGDGAVADPHAAFARVKAHLPPVSGEYWKSAIRHFEGTGLKGSFYHRGAAGDAAWFFLGYLYRFKPDLRAEIGRLLDAPDLSTQQRIYDRIEPRLWDRVNQWMVRQPALMAMLGVPRPQMALINQRHPGGLSGYVKEKIRHVFTRVPIRDNYFWRVYITGAYTRTCCPNYLKDEHFPTIGDRIHRIRTHTATLSRFLESRPGRYSHFVLLDHQDWMAWYDPEGLVREWSLILANSTPGTRILIRSAGPDLGFLPDFVKPWLRFRPDLTAPRHGSDRVGTYGSLHLAEVG